MVENVIFSLVPQSRKINIHNRGIKAANFGFARAKGQLTGRSVISAGCCTGLNLCFSSFQRVCN